MLPADEPYNVCTVLLGADSLYGLLDKVLRFGGINKQLS